MVKPAIDQGVASEFLGLSSVGAQFREDPHPDRLGGMVLCWDGIDSLTKNWDGESNVIQHFKGGGKLYIPAALMARLKLEVQFYEGERKYPDC